MDFPGLIADFRPASEAAEQDLPSFSAGTFMQV
jgi:hypothetical protein